MLTKDDGGGLEVKSVRTNSDKPEENQGGDHFQPHHRRQSNWRKGLHPNQQRAERPQIQIARFDRLRRYPLRDVRTTLEQQGGHRPHLCRPLDSRKHFHSRRPLAFLLPWPTSRQSSWRNAQLVEQMIEKKRMEHELALAGDIQQNLLPSKAPLIEGWGYRGNEYALLYDRRRLLRLHPEALWPPRFRARRRLGERRRGSSNDDGFEGHRSFRMPAGRG